MIYDCFTFFNEIDLLEIRLNILNDYVDKFVLVEGNKTHTGTDKEFIFENNKNRFSKFLDKIIYIKVDDFPPLNKEENDSYGNNWLYENYQRDSIMRGLVNCNADDIIFISDCDEIWNPDVLKNYKRGICSLKQYNCYYNFNTIDLGAIYTKKAKLCHYSDLLNPKQDLKNIEYCKFSKKGLPTYLRFCKGKNLFNSGWHFSYIGSVDKIIEKRKAIVEQQFNTVENICADSIAQNIENGEDILSRGIKYLNIIPDDFLPLYLIKNIDKYSKYICYKHNIKLKMLFLKFFLSKFYSKKLVKNGNKEYTQIKIVGIKINLQGRKISNIFKYLFNIEFENNDKRNRRIITICGVKIKYRPKNLKITQVDKDEYIEYVLNNQLDNSCFVTEKEPIKSVPKDVKLIAYYLPQYHAIPENDKWFLKGFTEWFNVAKTVPQYNGHWQPHLPIDVGFYNLETLNIMKRQIELAKNHGISGFCYYYYWFNGQKLLEKPIEKFLEDKSLDMPFCLFWDSSNWTKTWNGGSDKDIMYEQKIEASTAERFMQDFLKYAKDERYIKFEDKPVLVVSTPDTFKQEELKAFIKELRKISKREISQDLYILTLRGNTTKEKYEYLEFDAMLEFLPLGINDLINRKPEKIINRKSTVSCFDMKEFVEEKKYLYESEYKTYKCCFPNWDNTARKNYRKGCIFQSTPHLYKSWLKDIIAWTRKNHEENDRYIFINAWNEWAEGAHLEPDQKYGYAFLNATQEALEETTKE